jgi:hypothetical protein
VRVRDEIRMTIQVHRFPNPSKLTLLGLPTTLRIIHRVRNAQIAPIGTIEDADLLPMQTDGNGHKRPSVLGGSAGE